MTEKDMDKFERYKMAFEQINKAIADEYFLEAISLEESIINDRLISLLHKQGKTYQHIGQTTLGKVISDSKNNAVIDEESFQQINHWRTRRNECLHQAAKSLPGEAIDSVEAYKKLAYETALEGKALARNVADYAKKVKRSAAKKKAGN